MTLAIITVLSESRLEITVVLFIVSALPRNNKKKYIKI